MRNVCDICKRKTGIMNPAFELTDAIVCVGCLPRNELSFKETASISVMKLDDFKDRIKGYNLDFKVTKSVSGRIKINETDEKILIVPNTIIEFKDIMNFELIEDEEAIASGGLKRAAVGGVLFGGAGAIVGAVTSKNKNYCNSLGVRLNIRRISDPSVYVDFISKKTKKKSKEYERTAKEVQEFITILDIITEQ